MMSHIITVFCNVGNLVITCTNSFYILIVWCYLTYFVYYIFLTTVSDTNANMLSTCFFFFSIFFYSFLFNQSNSVHFLFYFYSFLISFLDLFFSLFLSVLQFYTYYIALVIHTLSVHPCYILIY
jgi:hypothetical protein